MTIQGFVLRVLGYKVQGLGFRVKGSGFRFFKGLGYKVYGLGFRVLNDYHCYFFLRGREGLLVTIVESSTAVDSGSQKVGTWI